LRATADVGTGIVNKKKTINKHVPKEISGLVEESRECKNSQTFPKLLILFAYTYSIYRLYTMVCVGKIWYFNS
jgi:hypothetical protein